MKKIYILLVFIYITTITLSGCDNGMKEQNELQQQAEGSSTTVNVIPKNTTGQGVIIEIQQDEVESNKIDETTDNNGTQKEIVNENDESSKNDDIEEGVIYTAVGKQTHVNANDLLKNLKLNDITENMLSADFWKGIMVDGNKTLSSVNQIKEFNTQNIDALDFLYNIFSLGSKSSSWIESSILKLSKSSTSNRYNESGRLLSESDYNVMRGNLNLNSIAESIKYGLITTRTNMRTWPTSEKAFDSVTNHLYDRFQETAVYVAEPVAILHESKDRKWYFVAMYNYMGWIPASDVAIGARQEVYEYANSERFLLVTGAKLLIQNPKTHSIQLDMGVKIPLADMNTTEKIINQQDLDEDSYIIKLPTADINGNLRYYYAEILNSYDVQTEYLNYNTDNIITQAFKLLTEEYGWGGDRNARDCSSFIMDVFRCFGINLPRNTGQQEQSAGEKTIIANTSNERKTQIFSEIKPGTVLYMNNHTMLYLGKYNNKEYIIHDITTVYEKKNGSLIPTALDQVAVTSLSVLTKRETLYRDLLTEAVLYSVNKNDMEEQNNNELSNNESSEKSAEDKQIDSSLERLFSQLDSEQIIVSEALNADSFKAKISLYEKINGAWKYTDIEIPGVLGKYGVGKKKEGDQRSPTGIFSIGSAFGFGEQINTNYPYFKINKNSFWVDDADSLYYNRLVHHTMAYNRDWDSAENMSAISLYKYGLVINYNLEAKQNAGSAIFMHTYKNEQSPTQGCTAVSEAKMKQIIDWLDYSKHPLLIQGTKADFTNWSEGIIEQPSRLPEGFVYVRDFIPDISEALAYATTQNFTGRIVPGYFGNTSILTLRATQALQKAQAELSGRGYSLLIYDAYRPAQAVESFVNWTKDSSDTLVKGKYYPNITKEQLIPQGYIGKTSAHSRGSTVDISIMDLSTGKELDMGGYYDYFGEITNYDFSGLTKIQRENRKLLKDVMQANGFTPYAMEWWHFRYTNEQFPTEAFNFPVIR